MTAQDRKITALPTMEEEGYQPRVATTKIKDLHGGINTQAARDAIMREPEPDRMIRSQHTLMKPPPESGLTNSVTLKLMRESGTRMAVKVVVLTATRDDHMGRVAEYNGLLVYHDEDYTTSPTDRPILGWIIASIPRAMSGGGSWR